MDALVENLENATLEASQHEPCCNALEEEVAAEVDGVDGAEEEKEEEKEEEELEEEEYNGHRALDIMTQDIDGADWTISGAMLRCVKAGRVT